MHGFDTQAAQYQMETTTEKSSRNAVSAERKGFIGGIIL